MVMVWINASQFYYAWFYYPNPSIVDKDDLAQKFLVNLSLWSVLVTPLTTWLFVWKNFDSVTSLLESSKLFTGISRITFWSGCILISSAYFVTCFIFAYSTNLTVKEPFKIEKQNYWYHLSLRLVNISF